MSKRESEQVLIFEKLKRKELTQRVAAGLLGVSDRCVRKKLRRYRLDGPAGLVHRNRGKPSPRKWAEAQEATAIDLLRGTFEGFGPTFAAEKLEELHEIKVSGETLRKAMIRNGIWTSKTRRTKHRKRRERMVCRGIMVQLDGSPHDWFEGRGPRCTLLVFIDDATSEILWLEFAKGESTKAVMGATKNYIKKYGRPGSFYVDFGGVFSVNTNNPDRDKITQFTRANLELGIKIINATSPQAKGRVERANKTMQDRLVKEFRLAGISSMAAANAFVRSGYLEKHNAQFAIKAAEPADAHRPLVGYDLDAILCIKEERSLMNDFTITYYKRTFQLAKQPRTVLRPRDKIMVNERPDGTIILMIRAKILEFAELLCRPSKPQATPKTAPIDRFPCYIKPAKMHPWRVWRPRPGSTRYQPKQPASTGTAQINGE